MQAEYMLIALLDNIEHNFTDVPSSLPTGTGNSSNFSITSSLIFICAVKSVILHNIVATYRVAFIDLPNELH